MRVLASRGAELYEELHQKRIEIQENVEKAVLEKLKFKMDKIKANQQKIQGPSYREPQTHKVGKILISRRYTSLDNVYGTRFYRRYFEEDINFVL